MKRLHILIAGLISLICLAGCSNNDKQDFYGTYTFEEVSYLSPLSSNTIDNINKHMAGTKYEIEVNLFKIKSAENPVEINSPSYIKEDIPDNFTVLSDIHSFIGNKVKNQYTILNKDGSKTHLRLYTSLDCLWIAFYNDNTVNGSEVIMYIYKLSKCLSAPSPQPHGQIYLYGEQHGVDKILDKEFELWYEYYHNESMRHLFVELPYYIAEFMNMWLQSDSDDILDAIYKDWNGTADHVPYVKEFYKKIKSQCPETIFHGTDVGHQYNTTGERFLKYLQSNNLKGSEQYRLAQEAIEQGKHYYRRSDYVYRENMMAENFTREFDKLSGESVMGIYGSAHTGLDAMDNTNSVPCMANQLKKRYDDTIHSEDLTKVIDPYRVDTIKVNGKDYKASYFGKEDLTKFFKDYSCREFWRLENAYDDFKDRPKTDDALPYNNYPMLIETGQVFVIDYIKKDGSVIRKYYRSDGYVWKGMPSTEEFTAE